MGLSFDSPDGILHEHVAGRVTIFFFYHYDRIAIVRGESIDSHNMCIAIRLIYFCIVAEVHNFHDVSITDFTQESKSLLVWKKSVGWLHLSAWGIEYRGDDGYLVIRTLTG